MSGGLCALRNLRICGAVFANERANSACGAFPMWKVVGVTLDRQARVPQYRGECEAQVAVSKEDFTQAARSYNTAVLTSETSKP